MIALAPPAGARQAGFTITRSIVAHAFDYDAGVLPSSVLLQHVGDVDEAVVRIAAATLDLRPTDLTADQMEQMHLPVRCAGLQLDLPSHVVPLARAAQLVCNGPALRAAMASWSSPVFAEVCQHDEVDQAISDNLLEQLAERGITTMGGGGRLVEEGQPAAADPLRPAVPEKQLLSVYLRYSADVK